MSRWNELRPGTLPHRSKAGREDSAPRFSSEPFECVAMPRSTAIGGLI